MTLNLSSARRFKADSLNVSIFENRSQLGKDAAIQLANTIRNLHAQQEKVNIIFASAPSQNEFLQALIEDESIEWSRINAFHMDEYIGLDSNAPQNFGVFLKDRLFSKVPINQVFYLNGNATDPLQECERYAELLDKNPVDIVCMGIGENCHIAFNDPHVADFNDSLAVKIVDLDLTSRNQQVNDGCFATLDEVPETALTLTIPTLIKPATIFCMVPGANKAQAIAHTLQDEITELYPSTILRKHPNAWLFIDNDSAGKLQ
jgi:glucosamine-6-phosphate deaminase